MFDEIALGIVSEIVLRKREKQRIEREKERDGKEREGEGKINSVYCRI